MSSPDATPYVDLRVYDKTPDEIKAAALEYLQSTMPTWNPQEGNVEMVLLEAVAIEVAEAVFSINRLPNAMTEVLLGLYGVTRDPGVAPMCYPVFTVYNTAGYTIPTGTEFAVVVDSTTTVSFFTDAPITIANGQTVSDGSIAAHARVSTSVANGMTNPQCELVTPLYAVESVALKSATTITLGMDPETSEAMMVRGVQKLQRLSETLVLARHFTEAALERTDLGVYRANTIDNWNLGVGAANGHVTVLVADEDGAALDAGVMSTLAIYLTSKALANLAIHVGAPTFHTAAVSVTVKKIGTYLDATVQANVQAVLAAYLDPKTWDWSGTLRRNDLIAIISQAAGVDYVVTLTTPAADDVVNATDGFVLMNPGTFTVTVT